MITRRVSSVLITVLIGPAVLAGCGDDRSDLGGPTTVATSPATTGGVATTGPTGAGATGASGGSGVSGASGPTVDAASTDLEDGRHFGYLADVDASGVMSFDLAYFYTGDEATEQAEARGDEAPPPNDYYIVNDNPRLRNLTGSPSTTIRVFDWNDCCDEQVSIDMETFADLMADPDGSVRIDGSLYHGVLSPYWVTVEDGVVTTIEEQYLP